MIASTPPRASMSIRKDCTSRQAASKRAWVSICTAHRPGATSAGSPVSGTSSASPSEWAVSVDSSSVFSPRSASRSAVAEAVVVLPTPPLPVNRTMRIRQTRKPSTRFFSSLSAVSMTTRSALRLSRPSIGMIRSTDSV